VAATPDRLSPGNWQPPQSGSGAGLGTCFQVLPSQCSISVVDKMLLLTAEPTAQALDAEVAATAVRPPPWLGEGLRARCHRLPFQCKIKVWPPTAISPTAQASRADSAATPCRGTKPRPRSGLGTLDQARPSQRSISGSLPVVTPTAQAARAEIAATADS